MLRDGEPATIPRERDAKVEVRKKMFIADPIVGANCKWQICENEVYDGTLISVSCY